MTRTIKKTLYKFEELDESAKDRAREWWRSSAFDDDWYHSVYDDCATIFEILGIDSRKPVKLMSGSTRYDPCIWFSGFSSQGDGACFEGSYRYAKGSTKKIRLHAPLDKTLHAIADNLASIQKKYSYRLRAIIRHSGHYYHELCTSIEVYNDKTGDDAADTAQETVTEELHALMRWIYRQLESENDYINSDDNVDENIRINEYEFYENGELAA